MPDDHPDRNNALQQLMDTLIPLMQAHIDQHWAGKTLPNFMMLMVDDDLMEVCTVTDDYNLLFDAMADIGAEWIQQGLVEPLDPTDETAAAENPDEIPRNRVN